MSVLCSFWGLVGACCLKTRIDGKSCEDSSDIELGSTEECEVVARYPGTYRILQKFYQSLCLDHRTYGETVEEGCHILLG